MMTISIAIDTDNAAFEDDRDAEVLRILRAWLARDSALRADVRPLSDINGNTVGSVTIAVQS